jgi:hypothetical protein
MRFNELYEFEKQDISSTLNEISDKCSDILSVLKQNPGKFLYRGVKNKQPVFHAVPRIDRIEASIPKFITEMVNDWLEQYGFKAHIANSLYVTSFDYQADLYGPLYIIFPENGFDFTWFERSADLWGELLTIPEINQLLKHAKSKKQYDININDMNELGLSSDDLRKEVEWVIMRATPKKTDIGNAIKSGHEIMLANAPYYAISEKYLPKISKWIEGL